MRMRVILFNTNSAIYSAISWREQVNFQWDDDDVRFVLDQNAELDFIAHWNNSPRLVMLHHSDTLFWFSSQPVFALSPSCCMLRGEATNTDSIVFGFTRWGLEPMIYHTRGEHPNHYTTYEPMIYHTRGEQPNHYTTYVVITNYLSIVTKTPKRIRKPLPCFQ